MKILFKNQNNNGISLISMIITIIILLILSGITISLTKNYIINKSVLAYSKTIEEYLKEEIEMAMADVNAINIMEHDNINISNDLYNNKLKELLENTKEISNVVIIENNSNKNIELIYKNRKYFFEISSDGKVIIKNSIKNEINIGDYVEYPISYIDMYNKTHYNSENGWRVIDDGKSEGTSGYIKIISTGIPLLWNYDYENGEYESNKSAVEYLLDDFENINFIDTINGIKYKGNIFNDNNLAIKVSTITFNELHFAYNKMYKRNLDLSKSNIFEDSNNLFVLNSEKSYFYWIADAKENTNEIYYISDEGLASESVYRIGIRPVIYLQNGLNGKYENNVWKLSK